MRIWTGLFLMAVMFTAAREAAAVDVGVGVSVGSRRHGTGGSFEFRTGDSHYNTWYPNNTTYVYTQPSYTTTTTYTTPSYTYTTPSSGYVTWYGSDRYRRHHHHHHHHPNHRRDRDRDHHHHHRR
jgi:hypothetical protein